MYDHFLLICVASSEVHKTIMANKQSIPTVDGHKREASGADELMRIHFNEMVQ